MRYIMDISRGTEPQARPGQGQRAAQADGRHACPVEGHGPSAWWRGRQLLAPRPAGLALGHVGGSTDIYFVHVDAVRYQAACFGEATKRISLEGSQCGIEGRSCRKSM